MTERNQEPLSKSLSTSEKRKQRKKLYRKKRAALRKQNSDDNPEVQKSSLTDKISESTASFIKKLLEEQQNYNHAENDKIDKDENKNTLQHQYQHQHEQEQEQQEQHEQEKEPQEQHEQEKEPQEQHEQEKQQQQQQPSPISLKECTTLSTSGQSLEPQKEELNETNGSPHENTHKLFSSSELTLTSKTEQTEVQTTESSNNSLPSKKRVYGVWLSSEEKQQIKKQRQHYGLRCRKCFALLCRDDDFEYKNGQLWVNPVVLHNGWEGLIVKGDRVFCQNMHAVGVRRATTWTNLTKYVPVLKVDKTTFIENFVNNPDFANSDKIKNKLLYASSEVGDTLKLSLLPQEYLPEIDEDTILDRYHPEEQQKTLEEL